MLIFVAVFALRYSVALALGPEIVGKPAPSFSLKTIDGRATLSLSEMRGQVVIVDFWASWCVPCQHSLPELAAFETSLKGLRVLAINIDDERQNALEFLTRNRVKLTSLYDENKHVVGSYDIPAMPSALIIDQQGIVRFVHGGYTERDMPIMMKEARSLL